MSKTDLMVEGTERPSLLEWQKALSDQRLQDAEAHPEDWVSWDEAKQRLERQPHGASFDAASLPD